LQRPVCINTHTKALVAVGSNLISAAGPPEKTVSDAIYAVGQATGAVPEVSRFYRTPAFPAGAGPDFVNACLALDWAGTAVDLLAVLHGVEADFGRVRGQRWAARVLDLDLLALGAQVLPDPETYAAWRQMDLTEAGSQTPPTLILPHPRLQERGFVLVPLADIAPDWYHPVTGLSVTQMRDALAPAHLAGIVPLAGQ
jgi:2-amino-4-hydroxy-6-hydroxymethyldihydropteridine diphosphokinase